MIGFEDLEFCCIFIYQNGMLKLKLGVRKMHIHYSITWFYLRPAIPLHFVFVVSTASLQDGLVNTSTTGDQADHGSVGRGDDLL